MTFDAAAFTASRRWGYWNVYTCEKCGYRHWTLDVDEGVTPFVIACQYYGPDAPDGCDGEAVSAGYNVSPMPPGYQELEWYRPTEDEIADKPKSTQEHVRQGGLLKRRVREPDVRRKTRSQALRRLRFA